MSSKVVYLNEVQDFLQSYAKEILSGKSKAASTLHQTLITELITVEELTSMILYQIHSHISVHPFSEVILEHRPELN